LERSKEITSKNALGVARMIEATQHKEFINAFFRAVNRTPAALSNLVKKKELQKVIKDYLDEVAKLNKEIKELMGGGK
jgi:23S rRNA A2030 N6-methylase RlmJ